LLQWGEESFLSSPEVSEAEQHTWGASLELLRAPGARVVAPEQADHTTTAVSLPAAFVPQQASLSAVIFPSHHGH